MKYLFHVKAALVGLCFLIFGGLQLYRTQQARQWPQKPALMVSSKIVTQRFSSGVTYRLDVQYQWEHQGQTYQGTQFGIDGTLVEESESLLRQKAASWAAGKTVTCWMNPNHPAEAVLSPEDDIETQVVLMVLGAGLFLWGAIWPVWAARRDARSLIQGIPPAATFGWAMATLFFGGVLTCMVLKEKDKRQSVEQWQEVPCRILESRVVFRHLEFSPDIHCAWQHEGRALEGIAGSASEYRGSVFDVEKVVQNHPAGQKTVCWVNPAAPYEMVLDRTPPLHGWTLWGIFAVLTLLCLGMSVQSYRSRRSFMEAAAAWAEQDHEDLEESDDEDDGEAEELGDDVYRPHEPPSTPVLPSTSLPARSVSTVVLVVAAAIFLLLFVVLLPIARREVHHGAWNTPAQCLAVIAGLVTVGAVIALVVRIVRGGRKDHLVAMRSGLPRRD